MTTPTSEPRIVALIPARGGSQRVARKNVRKLAGKPLLSYTIAAARAAGIFEEIYVSTEDPEIQHVALAYGADVVIRPEQYAANDSPDIDWVRHALLDCHIGDGVNAWALLRPTSPFRSPEAIRKAWEQWQCSGRHFDSLRAVKSTRDHPGKSWVLVPDYWSKTERLEPFHDYGLASPPAHSRATQSLPPVYIQSAALEIAHVGTVLKKGSISGDRIMPFFMDGYEDFDVNLPEDWLLAEALIREGFVQLPVVV